MTSVVCIPVADHVVYFVNGVRQAFSWSRTAALIHSSRTVQRALFKTVLLNGVIFLGILFILDIVYGTPEHTLFGYSYTTLTGYPMYSLCIMANANFFSQIAKEAFSIHDDEGQRDNNDKMQASTAVGLGILYMSCAAFIRCLRAIPVIGTLLSFFVSCIFMAYYCFDYKWMHLGWSLEQRLAYVEKHWAFFLGFGLPATLLTFFLSTLHAGAMFALVYPSHKEIEQQHIKRANLVASTLEFAIENPGVLACWKENKDQLGKLV